MRTLDEIRTEIEQLTEERAELLHKLAQGHDALLPSSTRRSRSASRRSGTSTAWRAPSSAGATAT